MAAGYGGEHEPIVDEELWNAVQAQLREKAPPRRRLTNARQQAMLRGLLSDPHGRPMVPTYGSKKNRRYPYYETRKDLARPGDPPSLRYRRGHLEEHLIGNLEQLLNDEHALRRLSGIQDAAQLQTMFATGHLLAVQLREIGMVNEAIRSIIAAITIRTHDVEILLNPDALGIRSDDTWPLCMPPPGRRPFREAKLRIDAAGAGQHIDRDLVRILAEAFEAQKLVLAAPDLTINQLANKAGRCRKQLHKLFRLSWLSPQIVDAVVRGAQPKTITRRRLLECDLPIDWSEQEELLGIQA